MDRVVVVEVLDRRGNLVTRARLGALPATIGRGYGCDLILDDPHVDAAHARLSEGDDGGLVVEDLGSVNGTWAAEGARAERLVVAPGGTVRVGHTLLRFATPELAVAPAVPDQPAGVTGWRALVQAPRGVLLLTALGVVVFGAQTRLTEVDGDTAQSVVSVGVGVAVLVALWAAGWAAGGRLARRRARFPAHFAVAWIGLLLFAVPGLVVSYLEFLFPGAALVQGLGWVVSIAASLWLLAAHLEFSSGLNRVRRLAWAAGVTAALTGLGVMFAQVDLEEASTIRANLVVRPFPARLVPAGTPEEFFARAAGLQAKVDEAAAEMP